MKRAIKKSSIAWRIVEGQAFIINTKTSVLHELDETGTFIWKLAAKNRDVEYIASELSSHYDVARDQAAKDTEEFFEELEKKGIMEPGR